MDQPPQASKTPSVPPSTNGKRPVDPDALPPSAARRAQLLLMLIVLPVIAVSLPAIFITMIFGQHPKPKTPPPAKSAKPAVVPAKTAATPATKPATVNNDTTGLHEALQRTAATLLPTPSTLTGEPVKLTCRPDRLAARAERVIKQAEAFGGTANEWLAPEGEKHFYVELPTGQAEAFRRSLSGDTPAVAPSPSVSPAAGPGATAIKDQVEIFIRANSDE